MWVGGCLRVHSQRGLGGARRGVAPVTLPGLPAPKISVDRSDRNSYGTPTVYVSVRCPSLRVPG